jgi:hypothetical protein
MNAKTLEAVEKHGRQLLALFPNTAEKNPVALCKKLRRIETAIAPIILRNCNEGVPDDEMDHATSMAQIRAGAILGLDKYQIEETGLRINRDPRGYALKFGSEWAADKAIYKDWGGYGIVAPDLTVD